jgi:transaldolase
MKATQLLHNLGPSIWLDNITGDLLNTGKLQNYIDDFSVTGLTSNPSIFDHAIKNSPSYDPAIRQELAKGRKATIIPISFFPWPTRLRAVLAAAIIVLSF